MKHQTNKQTKTQINMYKVFPNHFSDPPNQHRGGRNEKPSSQQRREKSNNIKRNQSLSTHYNIDFEIKLRNGMCEWLFQSKN